MSERLVNMGAFQVSIDMTTIDDECPDISPEIVSADNIPAACIHYIDLFAPDHLDKDILVHRTGERLL
jgi:hypothetical protein